MLRLAQALVVGNSVRDMKLIKYLINQSWTLAGVGLVLITLSGSTRSVGLKIAVAAFLFHLISVFIPEDKDYDEHGE